MPTTGVAGAWQASVAPNGFVTGANMMEIVQDINNYKEANNFDTILFWMDGFSGQKLLQKLCSNLELYFV